MRDRIWMTLISLSLGTSLCFASQHWIRDRDDVVPAYLWTAGCCPTAAMMVLGHYDWLWPNNTRYASYGKLADYYFEQQVITNYKEWNQEGDYFDWDGYSDGHDGIPYGVYRLAYGMHTDAPSGGTDVGYGVTNIKNGILYWANTLCGYSFSSGEDYTIWNWDAIWNEIKEAVDGNHPCVWGRDGSWGSSHGTQSGGHCVCVIGYNDNGNVYYWNTWDPAPLYYYSPYQGNGQSQASITSVTPGGGSGGNDVELYTPDGGENWEGKSTQEIKWYQFGSSIDNVKLLYSPDAGYIGTKAWYYIVQDLPSSQGWNYYSWTVPNITNEHVFVKVKAYSGGTYIASEGSEDRFTITKCNPPSAPSNCQASDNYCDKIVVTWDDKSNNEDGFEIYRDGSPIVCTTPNVTNYTDHPSAGTYSYYVKAHNTCGESSSSNSDNGTRLSKPTTPTNCQASDDQCDKIVVTWDDKSNNETAFYIYRNGVKIGQVNAGVETYPDTPLAGTYSYYVKAHNTCGESPASNSDNGIALTKPVANFTSDDTLGCIPCTVNFADLSINDPTSWSWDFGDGNTSILKDPSHTYEDSAGDYTVILIATNSCGPDTMTKSDYIHILAPDITVTPDSCDYGNVLVSDSLDMTFTVSDTGAGASCSLHVSNISIIDDTANAFSVVSDTSFTVAIGGSDTIVVRFAPKSEGKKGATLRIESDDPDSPIKEIPLSGHGKENVIEELKVMLPKAFYLSQNLPNPAISMTRIPFGVPQEAHITLTIYDISGKKVRTLMARTVAVGHHIINWNGKDDSGTRVAKGIYFYRMEAGKFKATRKLTILK